MTNNTVRQHFNVDREDRRKLNQHNSFLVWFTGLSGSGKSTIANELEHALHAKGINTYLLDGDNVRQGLNKDLKFTAEDRSENIRRIAEVANLMVDAGNVVLAAFIAPYREDRKRIQEIVGEENYIEIYVSTSLEECEKRDVKGLYAKARKGEIPNFTGISAPYEAPESPNLEINTEHITIEAAVQQVLQLLETNLSIHE